MDTARVVAVWTFAARLAYVVGFVVLRFLCAVGFVALPLAIAKVWLGPHGAAMVLYALGVAVGLWALLCFPVRALKILAGLAVLFLTGTGAGLLSYRTDPLGLAYGLGCVLGAAGLLWLAFVTLPRAIDRAIERRRTYEKFGKALEEGIESFRKGTDSARWK